ncbi:hypothetical protein BDN72DRAFT_836927, partial [Pluteus cervinus]
MNFMTSFPPKADDIAVVIGLKAGPSPSGAAWAGESQRSECLRQWVMALRGGNFPVPAARAILSEYSAKYLPATVDRFLVGHVAFPVLEFNMIMSVYDLPHFGRYLRSKHPIAAPGKRLCRVVAERFAAIIKFHQRSNTTSHLHTDCRPHMELLLEILNFHWKDQEAIPSDVEDTLMSFLEDCQNSADESVQEIGWSLYLRIQEGPLLGADPSDRLRGKNVCGLPGCGINNDLKNCGRCVLVSYDL